MRRLAALVLCAGVALPAWADGLDAGPTDHVALDLPKDVAITVAGAVGSLVPLIFASQLGPSQCRWCGGPLGEPVNPVDDWFHQRLTGSVLSVGTANAFSSVLAYGVLPAGALGAALFATGPDATAGAGLRNVVIVAESVAVAGTLTNGLKLATARQRPSVHYGNATMFASDANQSFPSGHTTIAAAVGTSAAMLATLERSPTAPWLWGATGVLTAATGTLRMVSENHYLTDVLAGAAIGAGCGVLFPLLHRRGSLLGGNAVPLLTATDGGAALGVAGAF